MYVYTYKNNTKIYNNDNNKQKIGRKLWYLPSATRRANVAQLKYRN